MRFRDAGQADSKAAPRPIQGNVERRAQRTTPSKTAGQPAVRPQRVIRFGLTLAQDRNLTGRKLRHAI